jgi:hypothetical protein
VEVGVDCRDGLDGEVAGRFECSFLLGELLRDLDVLGVRLRGTAAEAPSRRLGRDGKGTVSRDGGKGEGEAHDGQDGKPRVLDEGQSM